MYLLQTQPLVAPSELEQYIEAHAQWVKQAVAQQLFLLAGPNRDAAGGLIITNDLSGESLQALVQADPFVKAGVVEYKITPFDIAFASDSVQAWVKAS